MHSIRVQSRTQTCSCGRISLSILSSYSSVTSFNVSPSLYALSQHVSCTSYCTWYMCHELWGRLLLMGWRFDTAANILSSFCSHKFNHKLGVGARRGCSIRLVVYGTRYPWSTIHV